MKTFTLTLLLIVCGVGKIYSQLPTCGNMATPTVTNQSVVVQSATTGGVTLNWTNVGATSYSMKYKLSSASQYTSACLANVLTCTANGLALGSTYNFIVQANRNCNLVAGEQSQEHTTSAVLTITLVPPVPVALGANSIATTSFIATWSGSAGATGYSVDASSVSSFSTGFILNNASTTSTSITVGVLSPGTTYYFRVRAVNAGNTSSNSQTFQVTTLLPPAPPAPTNLVTSSIGTTSCVLNWSGSTGVSSATGYRLDFSSNNTFGSGNIYNDVGVSGTTNTVSGLTPGTNYFWRVRGVNAGGTSPNSVIASTITLSAAPINLTASSVTTTSFTASWSSSTGASSYRLDVASDNSFSTGKVLTDATVSTTSRDLSGLIPGTTYYFRVRAVNNSGTSANSTVVPVTLPPSPPVNLSTSSVGPTSFILTWPESNGATSYMLDVSSNSTFSGAGSIYGNFTVTTLNRTITGLNAGTTYYSRLRAVNTAGVSTYSSVKSVVTRPPVPTNLITNSITETSFNATWSASAGASDYRLDVASNSSFTSGVVYNNLTVTSTSQAVTGLIPGTTYYFRVRAFNSDGGNSANSQVVTVLLPPATPTVMAATNITPTSFTAHWQTIGVVAHFYVDVSTDSSFSTVTSSDLDAGVNTSLPITGLQSGRIYFYRVRGSNASGTSPNSNVSPRIPTPLTIPGMAPPDSVRSESFVAVWNAVPGANTYLLDVSPDASFDSLIYDAIPVTSTRQNVGGLSPRTNYHFRIKASSGDVTSSYSSATSVTTSNVEVGNPDGGAMGGLSLPPSPDAAALARYAEAPVSLYTGTPEISIPIYVVKERDLTLPVSLNYHAGGNKVENVAPRTGLGWTLDAGGAVTRTMRGQPDELRAAYTNGMLSQTGGGNPQSFDLNALSGEFLNQLSIGATDLEPDLFQFNFAGYAGTFMFDWDGKVKMMSPNSLKIEPIGLPIDPDGYDFIDGWKITVDDGTIFTFTAIDSSAVPLHYLERGAPFIVNVPQAWYLTEMRSSNQASWVRFEYSQYRQMVQSLPFEAKYYHSNLEQLYDKSGLKKVTTRYFGQNLKKITTSSGQTTMDFFPDVNPRTDIGGDTTANGSYIQDNYALGKINVTNVNGKQVKGWSLGYDYGTGRLTLATLTETIGTLSKPPYQFSYYPGSLPGTTSFARDHWGFYNSNFNWYTLIPPMWVQPIQTNPNKSSYALPWLQLFMGADRSPDKDKVLCGMLKQVTYPTGGKDLFEFEPHDYSFVQDKEEKPKVRTPQTLVVDYFDIDQKASPQVYEFTLDEDQYVTIDTRLNSDPKGGAEARIAINVKGGTQTGFYGAAKPDDTGPYQFRPPLQRLPFLAGTYEVSIYLESPNAHRGMGVHSEITYSKITGEGDTKIVQGGGVRIAKVTRSFGFGNADKVTRYLYQLNEGGVIKSSGSLVEPIPTYRTPVSEEGHIGPDTAPPGLLRFAQSALGTTQGSHVGYSHVTVSYGENVEMGKCINHFTSPRTVLDIYNQDQPFPPTTSFDYARGLLLDQTHFAASGDTVKTRANTYSTQRYDIQALKATKDVLSPAVGYTDNAGVFHANFQPGDYAVCRYFTPLGYTRLTSQTEKLKQGPNLPQITTSVYYTYNDSTHKQLVTTSTTNSKGETIVNRLKYPKDYGTGDNSITTLKDRHIDNVPVESLMWRPGQGQQVYLISAVATGFTVDSNSNPNPTYTSAAKIVTPQLTSDPFASAAATYDRRVFFSKYDTFGNLLESSPIDGVKTSFQWNYNGTLPTAKVENASSALKQFFFESFEEEPSATALQKRTGLKSKAVTGPYFIPSANLPTVAGDYILSYWTKEGVAAWTYQERNISYAVGTSIATGAISGYLDDVRLYPKGAVMVTCTYEPLIGMTSLTSANNQTLFFEYDDFGRLKHARDQDRNIVNSYDYQINLMVPYKPQGE